MNLLPGQTVTMGSGTATIKSLAEQGGGKLVISGALTVTGTTNIVDTLEVVSGTFTANGAATINTNLFVFGAVNSIGQVVAGTLVAMNTLEVDGGLGVGPGGVVTANGTATVTSLGIGNNGFTLGAGAGSFTANGAATVNSLTMHSGLLTVPGSLILTGSSVIDDGAEIDGPGTVTNQGTQLALSNSTLHTVLVNQVTATVSGLIDLGQTGVRGIVR
jgi:hypothetical protein